MKYYDEGIVATIILERELFKVQKKVANEITE